MPLGDIVRFGIIGAASGGLYGLLALGLVVVYRSSRVVNFAHASIAVAAAYVFYDLRSGHHAPLVLAGLAALAFGTVVGALIEIGVMTPLRKSSPLTRAIASIGVLVTVQGLLNVRYGQDPKLVQPYLPTQPVDLFGIAVGADRLLILSFSLLVSAVLFVVYRRTRFGVATSALAESRRSIAALGWSPKRLGVGNWAVSGLLASIAGILIAPITGLTPGLALTLVLPALAAAVLGRLTSFPLTVLGALLIAIAQAELGRFTHVTGLQDAVPFIGIMIVLVAQGSSLPVRGYIADVLPRIGSGRIPWIAVAIGTLLTFSAVQWWLRDDWVQPVTTCLVVAIILLSLVVVTGYAGQLSLASFGLAGIGALVAAKLVSEAHWSFLPAALVGVVAAGAVGVVVGLPAIRTRGITLAIVTLGLAVTVQSMILDNSTLTKGTDGLPVGSPHIFGINVDSLLYPRRYAVLALVVFVLLGLMVLNVRRSSLGRRLVAVRTNERAAASLGIGVVTTKLFAFVLSGLVAAVGGILLAFINQIVVLGNPGAPFDPFNSVNAVAGVTIGGVGFVGGAWAGTAPQPGGIGDRLLTGIGFGEWLPVVGGLLLLLTVITAPDGVAANMQQMFRGLTARFPRRPRENVHIGGSSPGPDGHKTGRAVLAVDGLTVAFGAAPVLEEVGFTLESGTVLGVIGPNGAGKTTLIDAITGFNVPRGGSIKLNGEKLTGLRPSARSRRGIIRSFQSLELFEDLDVAENLLAATERPSWVRTLRGLVFPGRPRLDDAVAQVMRELKLDAHLHAAPRDLSYGDRRLLAIARAMAARPTVLLLDEPAAGLGELERTQLRSVIRMLAERWGTAVLLVEHDVDLVMDVSDQVLALDFGRTIAVGSPEEIRRHPAVIEAYLGTEEDLQVQEPAHGPLTGGPA